MEVLSIDLPTKKEIKSLIRRGLFSLENTQKTKYVKLTNSLDN